MADRVRVTDAEADEAGEAIHLPGPSYQPVALAFGLTLAITGVVIFPALTVIGLIIVLVTLWMWIRDTRREVRELPLEHDH
jgi:Cytochrome c oxidase subunit IV